MAQLFNDTPDRQDLGAISIGSRSRQILKKKFRKNIKSSLSYENFKISKVGGFFFPCFFRILGGDRTHGDHFRSTWGQLQSCSESRDAVNEVSNFFEKSAVLKVDFGTFDFKPFKGLELIRSQ